MYCCTSCSSLFRRGPLYQSLNIIPVSFVDEESEASSAESEDLVVSSEELVALSEDLVVQSEETENNKEQPLKEEVKAVKIQEFSDNLVNLALSQAMDEVNNNCVLEDFVDGDIVTNVMKKSLIEVFGSTPEKARRYSESLLSPSPLPKCLSLNISGSNTPIVPSTPPSSPAIFDLDIAIPEETSLDSERFNTSLSSDISPEKFSAFSLSAKSFADSLSNSLMSCVELTSSLATAIATAATSPGQVVAGTKEAFCKSPKSIGSPVKNGGNLISFLNQKGPKPETPPSNIYSNGFHLTEFVEDLSSLVKSSKLQRFRGKDDTDGCEMLFSARQNLLEEFDQIGNESKEKESNQEVNISSAKVYEKFATTLSSSIVDSAIISSVYSKGESSELEMDAVEIPSEDTDSETKDLPDRRIDTGAQSPQRASQITGDQEFSNILNSHVDALLVDTITSALDEAAEYCVEKSASGFPLSAIDEEDEQVEEKEGSEEMQSGTAVVSGSDESDASSSESYGEEQSDLIEGDKLTLENSLNLLSSVIPEAVAKIAEKLSQKIIHDGVAQASEMVNEKSKEATTEIQRETPREVTKLEAEKKGKEESLSLSDEEVAEEETFNGFAEDLSCLTINGAVKIAEAFLEDPAGEPRVRPVATGNWGCGVFKGDPELKAVIQWAAASAAGCPVMVYHTFGDQRMSRVSFTLKSFHFVILKSFNRFRLQRVFPTTQGILLVCIAELLHCFKNIV